MSEGFNVNNMKNMDYLIVLGLVVFALITAGCTLQALTGYGDCRRTGRRHSPDHYGASTPRGLRFTKQI